MPAVRVAACVLCDWSQWLVPTQLTVALAEGADPPAPSALLQAQQLPAAGSEPSQV